MKERTKMKTLLFYRCGQCKFSTERVCLNAKTLSFGENVLDTYFSCSGFEAKDKAPAPYSAQDFFEQFETAIKKSKLTQQS
jgi:hypothetical protein